MGGSERRATGGEPEATSGETSSHEAQAGVIGSGHPTTVTRTGHAEQAEQTLRYRCQRTRDDLVVDGDLAEETWALAERSALFSDHTGARALFDTTAAMAWDDQGLYIGFWLEDRDIQATQAKPAHEVREDSHVGVLITGPGAYYDLAVNPLGATSEMCYIWKEAYRDDDRFHVPEFDLAVHRPEVLGRPHADRHPRHALGLFGLAHARVAGRGESGRRTGEKGPGRPGMDRGVGPAVGRLEMAGRWAETPSWPMDRSVDISMSRPPPPLRETYGGSACCAGR